jgi:hypothetical protein
MDLGKRAGKQVLAYWDMDRKGALVGEGRGKDGWVGDRLGFDLSSLSVCLSVCLSAWLLLGRQSALFCCRALVLLRWFVTYLLIPILMSTTIVLMMCSVLSCPLTRREGVGMYLLCCCWRRGTYILCSPTNSRMSSKAIKRIFGISWHW